MKYEVVNIVQQYKDGNIDAIEAMNTITPIIFPDITSDDKYIKRLIAFMFDVEEAEIDSSLRHERIVKPKAMYTYFLSKKYTPGQLNSKLAIQYNAINNRLKVHESYLLSNQEYKKIFNIIKRVIQ